jgi:precorrin-6B methylase 1
MTPQGRLPDKGNETIARAKAVFGVARQFLLQNFFLIE